MVWKTIKAVYGYAIDVTSLDNDDLFDEDGYIDWQVLRDMFIYIKPNLDCTPRRILDLSDKPTQNDQLIAVYPYSMNGDGIAVGRRPVGGPFGGKLVNAWASRDTIDETYDYSIPEFEHYVDKSKFHHYKLLHHFPCCSESMKRYVVIGVTYDEMDRNLFLDKTFDDICEKVFNTPTKIEDLGDPFFQHDSRDFKSDNDLEYGKYTAEIHSSRGVRKRELLNPNQSVKSYVDTFKTHYPNLGQPACYLMLDDCTFCT
jgi:hypothetical protein